MAKKFLTVEKRVNINSKLANLFDINIENEKLNVLSAVNRFSAKDVYANFSIPSFIKSLVDGFAVIASDTKGASSGNPIPLKLAGKLHIGEKFSRKLDKDECVFVPTGGMVPDGADAIVMIEYTEETLSEVFVMKEAHTGENLVRIGDDFKEGEKLIYKGDKITPNIVAAARAFGIREIDVFQKIKIGIFSTGDELVESGNLPSGKIYDTNEYTIFAEAVNGNFYPGVYGIVGDDKSKIKSMLKKTLSENDVVLMSGGTSKGIFDFTVSAINEIGKPGVCIHGLHLSPGKPTVFGVVNRKLVVGLSGNPLASFLVFRQVIIPLIYKKLGILQRKYTIIAMLSENLPSRKGREEFVIGKLFTKNSEQFVKPVFSESAFISPLIKGDGLITVPLMSEGYRKGDRVTFELW